MIAVTKSEYFDIVLVGSGFSNMMFLSKILERKKYKKILVLEKGGLYSHKWQLENGINAPVSPSAIRTSGQGKHDWPHTIAVGGGSNCWWCNAMRMVPNDFKLKQNYNIGVDWPVSYDDLESYYTEAEYLMDISGDNSSSYIFPRSRPFPQPRHRYSSVASKLKEIYPNEIYAMPQARARLSTNLRNTCCSLSRCGICPNNAKFLIVEEKMHLFSNDRVELRTECEVCELVASNGVVSSLTYNKNGERHSVSADVFVLGANGIYNPFLLLKSGIDNGPVGKGLHEQIPIYVEVDLDGLVNGDGSSHIAAVGYNFSAGDFRQHSSGGFYEITNLSRFRPDRTRYQQFMQINFLLDDLRQDRNYVEVDSELPERPHVHFEDWSPYAYSGLEYVKSKLNALLSPLPITDIRVQYGGSSGHAHLQGTTVMGNDPGNSVIDHSMTHHKYRNLIVLGSGAFPTAGGVNPTLTICALALRSADLLIR
jgi:choline dehydrogenase-like flavoprotein